MTTLLPLDAMGKTIDALRLSPGHSQTISVTSSSARNSTAFQGDTVVIAVYSTKDCFIRTGTSGVAAENTDHFLPGGFFITLSLKGDTHLAAIRSSENGTIYISELE